VGHLTLYPGILYNEIHDGDVAQLGERVDRTHEVVSSNLIVSTDINSLYIYTVDVTRDPAKWRDFLLPPF
jgi:hypothetical protein